MGPITPAAAVDLSPIPVFETGPAIGIETLGFALSRAHTLLDAASGGVPKVALKLADAVSRAWLARTGHPYLAEIDAVAARIGRPGAHFFNVHYEWGCSTGVRASTERTACLLRVLDWRTKGLGRHVIAARVSGASGPWITLTWPGFTGVLQAMAPGRFSAALNQAPMAMPTGLMPADWVINRYQVWRRPHLTPGHLLRKVFEEAHDFEQARRMLVETPLCVPAIYTLAGLDESEGCVIERMAQEARIPLRSRTAANNWQTDWRGRARGLDCAGRMMALGRVGTLEALDLGWLAAPVLNQHTRLALVADAARGRILAQGYEDDGPATAVLTLAA